MCSKSAVLDTVRLRLQPEFPSHSLRRYVLRPDQGDHPLPAQNLEGIIPACAGRLRGKAPPPERPMDQVADLLLFHTLDVLDEQADLPTGWPVTFSSTSHRPWPCRA